MFNIQSFTGGTTNSGGGFDLSQLGGLFGNSSGGGSGGFDLSQLGGVLSGASGGGQSGGAGSAIGGVLGGALGTLIPIPGIGTALGAGLGSAIGGLFGGGGVPNHEDPDEIKIAKANGITQQQASDICGYEESHSPRNYDDICKQAASDNNWLKQLWANYNRDHPSSPILPQQVSQANNAQEQLLAQLQMIAQAKAEEEEKAKAAAEQAKASKTTTYALFGGGALLAIIIAILLLKK